MKEGGYEDVGGVPYVGGGEDGDDGGPYPGVKGGPYPVGGAPYSVCIGGPYSLAGGPYEYPECDILLSLYSPCAFD